ncbi:MAG: hypothetical protein M1133_08335 [Armatimonadetes bacterium]|nr:hypothetical protein [Armatimonadota bacterium]
MADASLRDGCIDIPAFKERLALCRGQISAVMASKLDPKRVVAIKGNMPLEMRYHPERQVIIYASDPAYLDAALHDDTGWETIMTMPMRIMTFHVDDLPSFSSEPFKLGARE